MKRIIAVILFFVLLFLLGVSSHASEPSNIVRYNSYNMTNASEVGILCTTRLANKAFRNKNADEFTADKVRKCVKDEFAKNGWLYELDIVQAK
jgi:hypothetical protein